MNSPDRTGTCGTGPNLATPASRPRRGFREESYNLLLLGIVLIAAIPRLYLAATQFIEYDGYWNAFIAQQDRWRNFIVDYRNNAHPPLYYFILRLSLWFGHSPLVYRAPSLLTGLAAIYVLERVASKVMKWTPTPLLVALVYGLALPSIIISCEVRQYMLCIFFILISYYFLLDVAAREGTAGSFRSRVFFSSAALLACLSHYCAVLYVAAVLTVAGFFVLLRRAKPLWKAGLREAATFGPVLTVTSYEYFTHFGRSSVDWNHLSTFYYAKNGAEPLGEFLLRNLQNTFNLFSPWPVQNRSLSLAITAGLLLVACLGVCHFCRFREPKNLAAILTILVTTAMIAEVMLASVVRIYPFGGFLRQQFFLFPFLALCVFLMVDRLALAIPRRIDYGLAAALALTTVAVGAQRFDAFPKMSAPLFTYEMQLYNRLFPNPGAVYTDQFNLIGFFLHHHDWKWQFVQPAPPEASVDIYRLSRGGSQMLLFRDKARWLLDFNEPSLYSGVAASLRGAGLSSITFFVIAQEPGPVRNASTIEAFRKKISVLSAAQGNCVQTLVIRGYDIFAELRTHGCTEEKPGAETGARGVIEDDMSFSIIYRGPWQSGHYAGALNDTLTFSNQPGAGATLDFQGSAIEYVYTKAFNRGKARVSIDGNERAVIDLYDRNIVWRSSATFSGLTPGLHTIEISVLNSRNPAARDGYVDIDALIPH